MNPSRPGTWLRSAASLDICGTGDTDIETLRSNDELG